MLLSELSRWSDVSSSDISSPLLLTPGRYSRCDSPVPAAASAAASNWTKPLLSKQPEVPAAAAGDLMGLKTEPELNFSEQHRDELRLYSLSPGSRKP